MDEIYFIWHRKRVHKKTIKSHDAALRKTELSGENPKGSNITKPVQKPVIWNHWLTIDENTAPFFVLPSIFSSLLLIQRFKIRFAPVKRGFTLIAIMATTKTSWITTQ